MVNSLFDLPNHPIIAHSEYNPVTHQAYIGRLEWGGPADEPALINEKFWKEFETVIRSYWSIDVYESQNPWTYKKVLLIRKDGNYHYCYYRYLNTWFKLIDTGRRVHRRLILTAMVWGLAWVPDGAIPGNKHLFKRRPD